jgi:hypothetical protein
MSCQRFVATLCAALMAALGAIPVAAAERHNLYSYNGWKVDLVVRDDDSLACVAGTANENDDLFAVRVDPMADVSVVLVFRNPQSGVRPLNINIHGITDWRLDTFSSFFYGGSFTFWQDERAHDFLEDLKKGRTLSISSPLSNQVFTRFLIDGSAPALASLAECVALIRSHGV